MKILEKYYDELENKKQILLVKNNEEGIEEKVIIKKTNSFLALFFGPIFLIYRKQYKLALFSFLTLFTANLYFFFTANRYLLEKYLNDSWTIIKEDDADVIEQENK